MPSVDAPDGAAVYHRLTAIPHINPRLGFQSESVRHCGPLSRKRAWGGWKPYFFVLNAEGLYWFDPRSFHFKGHILLDGASLGHDASGNEFEVKVAFVVSLADLRYRERVRCRARSARECQQWLAALRAAAEVPTVVPPPQPLPEPAEAADDSDGPPAADRPATPDLPPDEPGEDGGAELAYQGDAEALVPRCALCGGDYQDAARTPKLLDCFHTFCGACLEGLRAAAGPGAAAVQCPRCGTPTALGPAGVAGLTSNFMLDDLAVPAGPDVARGTPLAAVAETVGATCPVCWAPYALADAFIPRLLPCGHSTCTRCLEGIVKRHPEDALCVICRARVLEPGARGVSDLPINYAMQRYMNELKNSSSFEQ